MHRAASSTALIVAGLLALPVAAHAKRADLAIRAVSAPTHATAYESLDVQVQASRTARTGAAKVGFYLSADKKRDASDTPLAGDAKIASGGPARKLSVAAQPRMPAAQAPGSYYVIACVNQHCLAAKSSLEVTPTPVTSTDLVDAAVAAHRLTPQQGLFYRALAAFGDPRLPAAYAGDPVGVDHGVAREVVEKWATLTASQRAALNPYFTPPAARSARASAAAVNATAPTCDTDQLKPKDWLTLAMPHGHVRVWWLKSMDKEIGPRARSFVAEIENHMWPRLVALLGREPLSDAHERCFHGIDGKLDIYMYGLPRGRGMTFAYPPKCKATPAFVIFESRNGLPDNWDVAHELFHTFQYSYNYAGACSAYNNWDEGMANWAASYLYPKDDGEHVWSGLMRWADESLADADYDAWVFPYAMQQLHGLGTIKAMYDQTERQPTPMQAVDAAVPGGLKQAFPEFARLAWNYDPIEPTFLQWDRFDQRPLLGVGKPPIGTDKVDEAAAGQNELDTQVPLKPLSRAYRSMQFGPGVTAVQVVTPYNTNLHVDAVEKLRDGTTKTEDLEKRRFAVFCPQTASQRLDSLLLVASNTSLTAPLPADPPIKTVATNIGCSRYTGTVSGYEHVQWGSTNTTETWTASNVVFERTSSGDDPQNFEFKLVGGTVNWSITGNSQGCNIHAGPVNLPVNTDDRNQFLSLTAWIGDHPVRWYSAVATGLPQVTGTAVCNGSTYTRSFLPHDWLRTEPLDNPQASVIPGDGILQGSYTSDELSGGSRTVKFSWKLVPDR